MSIYVNKTRRYNLVELIPALCYTDRHVSLGYVVNCKKLSANFRVLYRQKRTVDICHTGVKIHVNLFGHICQRV